MNRRRTTYGKKGGEGPTRGRKATTYEAELPDGTVARKRSYFVDTAEAFMSCYEHDGKWYANSVEANVMDWGRQRFVEARRVGG